MGEPKVEEGEGAGLTWARRDEHGIFRQPITPVPSLLFQKEFLKMTDCSFCDIILL